LRGQLPTVSRKSETADAIGYAMNQWQALTRYLSTQNRNVPFIPK
jgi:hypothetical protein